LAKRVVELAAENPKLVAITAAMAIGTGLSAFSTAYPERFFDVALLRAMQSRLRPVYPLKVIYPSLRSIRLFCSALMMKSYTMWLCSDCR
jgi:hypothetical protein